MFLLASGKSGTDDLFDKLDTNKLNAHLKDLMPGLTAKVFRTYNASITLDDMVKHTWSISFSPIHSLLWGAREFNICFYLQE